MFVGLLVVSLMMGVSLVAQKAAAKGDAAAGKKTFDSTCAMCHGPDGAGTSAMGKTLKVRDLRSAEVQGQSDEQLFEIISKGKGKMQSYDKTLGAAKIHDVVAYIRELGKKK
jgi:mono/diheme cytochrome c family protein